MEAYVGDIQYPLSSYTPPLKYDHVLTPSGERFKDK